MENLESMTKPQLAAAYNELADKLGRPRTNRMESREAGIRRVRALLVAIGEQESPSAGGTAQGKFLIAEPPKVEEKPRKPLPDGVKAGEPVNSQGSYYAPDGTLMNKDGTRSIFDDVDEGEAQEKPTHASAAADTWRDENVRAARAMRHRVEVAGVEYRSVSAAFKALRLPLAKHSPFRGALVKAGTLDFEGHTFKVLS